MRHVVLITGVGFLPIAFIVLGIRSPRTKKNRPAFDLLGPSLCLVGVQWKIVVWLRWFAGIAETDRITPRRYLRLSGLGDDKTFTRSHRLGVTFDA